MIDTAVITIKAGKGGDGLASFRHEKYIPKGGPWGGDGGKGGNVIFAVDPHLNTLTDFRRLRKYQAENGKPGMRNRKIGRDGSDITLKIPAGTIIYDANGKQLFDLTKPGEKIILAYGGKGGLGNWHFKSSTNQTPKKATPGENPEPQELHLELQLLADVGLIGLPSAGKSSLLNSLARTEVKTAEYHFTTVEPNLGVLENHDLVVADIPGLIEGAAEGRGLGHDFLRHIERSEQLVHIIDGSDILNYPITKLVENYNTIRREIEKWDVSILQKPEIIVINKIDLNEVKTHKEDIIAAFRTKKIKDAILFISAATKEGLEDLTNEMLKTHKTMQVQKARAKQEEADFPQPKPNRTIGIEDLKNKRIIFKTPTK